MAIRIYQLATLLHVDSQELARICIELGMNKNNIMAHLSSREVWRLRRAVALKRFQTLVNYTVEE